MQSMTVFVLAVLSCIFAFISWVITADLVTWYQFYSKTSYFKHGIAYGYGDGYGPIGPLAISGFEMIVALLINLTTPALALYAWRDRKNPGCIPRVLNLAVLGLSGMGIIVAIAQFSVFAHEDMLVEEVAGQAVMFFLATLFGIWATTLPLLCASWTEFRKQEPKGEVNNPVDTSEPTHSPAADDIEAGNAAPVAAPTAAATQA